MKRIRYAALICMVLIVSAVGAYAEGPSVSGVASVDVMTNYVWRGQTLSNSWVIQPAVSVSYGGFTAALWANYDSDRYEGGSDSSGHGEVTETDLTLSYSRDIGDFTLGAGYIYYAFDAANDTQEVFATATYNVLLSPTLAVFYDYDEGDGWYIQAAVSHTFDLPKNLALRIGASASYNIDSEMLGYDKDGDTFSGFYNGEVSTALTMPVTDHISITPKVAYSFALSDDAKNGIGGFSDDGRHDILYGGVNVTLSF